MLNSLATFCYRKRWLVLILWIVALIGLSVASGKAGNGFSQSFSLSVTDSQTATAYSVAQQLITTAWSLLFGIVLMVWVFGWGGGRTLLTESYGEAKRRAAEAKAAHDAKKAAAEAAS